MHACLSQFTELEIKDGFEQHGDDAKGEFHATLPPRGYHCPHGSDPPQRL